MSKLILLLPLLLIGCYVTAPTDTLPTPDAPWVIRTFEGEDDLWVDLQAIISAPYSEDRFLADVRFIDESKYYNLDPREVIAALPDNYPNGFCFVAGSSTTLKGDPLIELVYYFPDSTDPADYERPPREVPTEQIQVVKAIPKAVQELENNLSLANIDMNDVMNSLSPDGIFRPAVPE